MITRARITWPDGNTTLVQGSEADVYVTATGVIVVTRGDQTRYIPPTSYKYVDVERKP